MSITLGIDTGGTYTDAALVEQSSGKVLAHAKALTTHRDLAIGIGQAVAAALAARSFSPAEIGLVALSTTLATNAIVEGRGSPVCLILIGYDAALPACEAGSRELYALERELATQDVVCVRGGHDGAGNELAPLDEEAIRAAVVERRGRVEAFAVSAYFGVRNSTHERRARDIIAEMTDAPVTCGHELTTRLNAVRRAATAALNARLIPLLRNLIVTVQATLRGLHIGAPLMVVRGDGSLVRAAWAMQRPVETILSGPAASVLGARHLAGIAGDAWVVDVGGTTTDIAALRGGRPRLNPEGAQVGGWHTMIEAVDVHTVGLGGDSWVQLDAERRPIVGPRRVLPLCLLASEYPAVVEELRRQVADPRHGEGQFVMALRPASGDLPDEDARLLRELANGPRPLRALAEALGPAVLLMRRIEALEARWLVARAAFTPTDALHVLGRFNRWDAEASRLGAALLAAQVNLAPDVFCEQVVAQVARRAAVELIAKALGDEGVPTGEMSGLGVGALLARALEEVPASALGVDVTLRHPLIAIGAPAEAYLPRTAGLLHTDIVIPSCSEVASAVGAAVGSVIQQVRVELRPLDSRGLFRLHLPDGVLDFEALEEGVAYAHQAVPPLLEALAQQAGADQYEVHITRHDRRAPVAAGWGEEVYLGTELTFTAVGRPRPAIPAVDLR